MTHFFFISFLHHLSYQLFWQLASNGLTGVELLEAVAVNPHKPYGHVSLMLETVEFSNLLYD